MTEDKCIACGWSTKEQKCCSYESHVKLFYGASTRGTWSIGSDVILKERPDDGPKTEVTTLKFLDSYPEIPVPKVLRDWVDGDGRYFVLTERMKGETLEKAWSSLLDTQKISITDEVIAIRKHLQSITSDSMQGVDGNAANMGLLFFDSEPHGPFHSDTELWDALSISLQSSVKQVVPKRVLDNLRKRMPKCEPCVLTHCDLNLGNIIVQDGRLVGILDWEYSAFLPV
ncbi:kinase-like protein [Penicillium malachiteum]|nr:kinase-like protein [Penicillium malachiteum]